MRRLVEQDNLFYLMYIPLLGEGDRYRWRTVNQSRTTKVALEVGSSCQLRATGLWAETDLV